MIKIIVERSYYTGEEVSGKGVLRAELIADTAAELTGVTEVGGNVLDFGSIALTADGKALMLDSNHVWYDLADGTAITAEVSGDD